MEKSENWNMESWLVPLMCVWAWLGWLYIDPFAPPLQWYHPCTSTAFMNLCCVSNSKSWHLYILTIDDCKFKGTLSHIKVIDLWVIAFAWVYDSIDLVTYITMITWVIFGLKHIVYLVDYLIDSFGILLIIQ